MEDLEIVKPTRKIGRATLYRINKEYPLVKKIDEIINEVSLQIAEKEIEKMEKVIPTTER